MRNFLIAAAFVFAVSAPQIARAACTYETRTQIGMAQGFYKDATTYSSESAESGDTDDLLAKAQWDNLKHELDLIGSDIVDCEEPAQQAYYLLEVNMDLISAQKVVFEAVYHREHPSPDADVAATDAKVDPTLVNASLTVLSTEGGELYRAHYARVNPADYAQIKQQIKSLYAQAGLPFKSWETGHH